MRAVQLPVYGDVKFLALKENVPRPEPKPDQILVEVHAAGLNPFDLKLIRGTHKDTISLNLPVTLAGDFAGTVAEVGDDVTDFSVGDEVYGSAGVVGGGSGTLAEYLVAKSTRLAHQPETVTPVEAAALPLVGVAAVQALEEVIQLKPDQTILIHGGAGGIGHVAVQLAKALGAYVATTVNAADQAFIKRLGADLVINYRQQPFQDHVKNYDAVLDTVGEAVTNESLAVLKTGGILVTMIGQPDQALVEKKGLIAITMQARVTTSRLERLAEWVDQGKLKVHVDKVFLLADTPAAFNHLANHPQGKVVVKVNN